MRSSGLQAGGRAPRGQGAGARCGCACGWGRGGWFRVSARSSEYPASCVTTESASRGRGLGAAGGPCALTESASPEFPAEIDVASLRSPASPRDAVPVRRPAPRAVREGAGGCLCPRREGTAPTRLSTPGPCSGARLSWHRFEATRTPAVLAAWWSLTDPWGEAG